MSSGATWAYVYMKAYGVTDFGTVQMALMNQGTTKLVSVYMKAYGVTDCPDGSDEPRDCETCESWLNTKTQASVNKF